MLSTLQLKHLAECCMNHQLLYVLSQAVSLLAFRAGFQGSLGENQSNGGVISRRRKKLRNSMSLFYMQSCCSFEVTAQLGCLRKELGKKKVVGDRIRDVAWIN